ncbi:MAG: ATP-dependent zinc metalloprotease FtsH [Ignavibacteriales bacterium]|nr:ATP-dependent zinc metalloprotease FtsH [Ignavibacteriales bacterium]
MNNQDKNQKKPEGNFDWGKVVKTVLSWGLIIVAAVIILQFMEGNEDEGVEVTYKKYQELLLDNKIIKAEIIKKDINNYSFVGTLVGEEEIKSGVKAKKIKIILLEPLIEKEQIRWEEKGIEYSFSIESDGWMNVIWGFLPWIVLIGVWIFLMRRMQGGGGGSKGIFNFGKSRAKLIYPESSTKVTFKDVAGVEEAKQELQEIIEFLKEPIKFQKLGGKIPKGVLLLGAPGTGKTLLARAIAGEAGVPFFSISGADFVEMFVGVGASRVRDLFEQGKKNAPCIIFIDEIDAVGRHRGAGLGGGHDEREQTLNQLLVEMDGFEQNTGVIIVAATNRPDVLDPALLRPGRFDRQVVVDRPDVKGREGILKVHTTKIPLDNDVDLKVLAKGTPGLAGAELANLVNEAALLAARKNKSKVEMEDFEEAKDKVMMGVERKSLIITEEEKKLTAFHEIGHVLVSRKIPESDPIHKVTIIPRGRALGLTSFLPIDEKHNYSKPYIEAKICVLLGGRAAEKIIFNSYTTGASMDIEQATGLARKMVCEWGMSEKLGPQSFGANEEEIFLGREITRHKDYSEKTAQEIDSEIKNIIDSCISKAESIIKKNIKILHALAKELLEREILDADEVDTIINGGKLPPSRKNNKNNSGNKQDEVPQYVKKLQEERMKKKSEKKLDDSKK